MWPFKKRIETFSQAGMFNGLTDWHSHILPGVDDGIRTLEDSLEVLKYFDSLGIKKVWLTPHIMEDYPNTTQRLRERFEMLREAWDGNVSIDLAAENMMDSLFEDRLEKGDLLPIGDEKDHILVETSYFNPPMAMDDIIDRIFKSGYFPLLAHPERYRYMVDDDYRRLRDRGVKFQLNYNSLLGGYGETARNRAEWLIKNDMIDVAGSDIHRLNGFTALLDKSPSKQDLHQKLQIYTHKDRIE